MARLIVKSPYIKGGGGAGGYLKYIGTYEGVELLPAGCMEYMAERAPVLTVSLVMRTVWIWMPP